MTYAVYVLPLVVQVVVPISLLASVWFAPGRSRAAAQLRLFLTAAYLVAIALAGLWLSVPWPLVIVFLAILALRTVTMGARVRSLAQWPRCRAERFGLALNALVAIAFVCLAGAALRARWPPPEQMVELEFPLRDGTYFVANGGSSSVINAHVQTLTAPRSRDYRGQSYGVDLVEVNDIGVRATGLVPRDPRAYAIFGRPIHAPCSGVVLQAEDGRPDMPPPEPDREHLPGNFVFLACGDVHVLLAHMQRGTVRVRPGERVGAGAALGSVGNSGNTNEPHLHIHAQRPARDGPFLSGDPLPMRLGGRFLARNDRIRLP